MPRCPECGEVIDYLYLVYSFSSTKVYPASLNHRGELELGNVDYRDEEDQTFEGYECPECGQIICYSDEEAISFLSEEEEEDDDFEEWSKEEW